MDFKNKYIKYKQKYLKFKHQLGGDGKEDGDEKCMSKNFEPIVCNTKKDFVTQKINFEPKNNENCKESAKIKLKQLKNICKGQLKVEFTESDEIKHFDTESPPSTTASTSAPSVPSVPSAPSAPSVPTSSFKKTDNIETITESLGGNDAPYILFPLMTLEEFKKNPNYMPKFIKP